MHLFKRTGRTIGRGFRKAFTLVFPARAGRRSYPGSSFDYKRAIGDGTQSSVVMATVNWSARTFPEAPVQVERLTADGLELVRPHPMVTLIEAPNPFYSGVLLWMATRVDWLINGNAYWLIVRANDGRPVQMWWLPSNTVEPAWPDDGSEFISHYDYKPGGTAKAYRIEVKDLVHFRYGLDPLNPRKGLSPLGAVLREVYTDDQAAQYTATILKNLGIPGLIIAPRGDDVDLSDEDAEDLKAKADERFGGDNRGRTMVIQQPTDVTVLGWNPQQLSLRELRRIPEERVTATLGIPAIVVGLGAGLDRSTFANFEEARQAAYESHIIPDQRLFAAELRMQLLPEYSDFETHQVSFDNSGVRVLQDDMNALYDRAGSALSRGAITVNDFLRQVGQPPKDDGDVYLRAINILAVPEGSGAVEPEPKSLALASGVKAGRGLTTSPASRLIPDAARTMERFFDGQASRTAARMASQGEGVPTLDWPASERRELAKALRPYQEAAADAGWDAALDRIGGKSISGKAMPESAPASIALSQELALRIVGIDETTRLLLAQMVETAAAAGTTARELAAQLSAAFAFSAQRAETIARTEMVNAQNAAAVAAWEDSGIVKNVEILDGDECGWTSHDDPDHAHGSVRSLDDFRANTLAHPNCVRVALPIVE